MAEELSAIAALHKAEQAEAHAALTAGSEPRQAAAEQADIDLTVDTVQANGTSSRVEIRLGALPDERREILQATLQRARRTITANIVLINKDHGEGLSPQLAKVALGQLRGTVDMSAPGRNKYVAIIFDVKCSGEATHRPNLRIPPLQRGELTLKPLLDAARKRLEPQLPSGEWHPKAPWMLAISTSCSTADLAGT